MIGIKTTVEADGFCGYFHQEGDFSDKALIVLMGDEEDDFLNNACARWLIRAHHCAALCIGTRQNTDADADTETDGGLHSWPLETIEAGMVWLKMRGVERIGIAGISMQACMALAAASLMPDFSLILAFSPCDFVPWGVFQDSRHHEWPSGTSAFSWRGKDLPFQPAYLTKQEYWDRYSEDRKKYREPHSISLFEFSENHEAIPEECFLKVEAIKGSVFLAGAQDDCMWNSARYLRRMEKRLNEKQFSYPVDIRVYPYGTHLLLPETMLCRGKISLGDVVAGAFSSGRKYPKECREARLDLEKRLDAVFAQWE